MTLRLGISKGSITENSVKYERNSITLGVSEPNLTYIFWLQTKFSDIILKQKKSFGYSQKGFDLGSGYTAYIPNTSFWLGGGSNLIQTESLMTSIYWLQSSYAISHNHWLTPSFVLFVFHPEKLNTRSFQTDLTYLFLTKRSSFTLGLFTSTDTKDESDYGLQFQINHDFKSFQSKSSITMGEFSRRFERETLLDYNNDLKLVSILREVLTIPVKEQLSLESIFELNVNELKEKQWFGGIGIAYSF